MHVLVLVWMQDLSKNVRHFGFELKNNLNLNFIPGQFITIQLEFDGQKLRRSYSIATIPGKSGFIEFAAGYVKNGPASKFLFDLKPGDQINVTGPHGRLVLPESDPERYIFSATSTGVTPFRAMLPELSKRLNNHPKLSITLLLGVQRREDLIFSKDFLEFSNQHENFEFRAYYSREKLSNISDKKLYEHEGYVQSSFLDLKLTPKNDIVYLCGNPKMIDDACEILAQCEFEIKDTKQVKREKYFSAKLQRG